MGARNYWQTHPAFPLYVKDESPTWQNWAYEDENGELMPLESEGFGEWIHPGTGETIYNPADFGFIDDGWNEWHERLWYDFANEDLAEFINKDFTLFNAKVESGYTCGYQLHIYQNYECNGYTYRAVCNSPELWADCYESGDFPNMHRAQFARLYHAELDEFTKALNAWAEAYAFERY